MIEQAEGFAILQELLDLLSTTPGAIIYRGPDGWVALEPQNPGDVLVLNSSLLPEWQAP